MGFSRYTTGITREDLTRDCLQELRLWPDQIGIRSRNVADLGGRGLADQPGSMPFALITASAAGAARNLMNALAASASLLAADTAAEK
jgi:hypothetical protein